MAKKAFLVGVNTQGLSYAVQDVTLMKDALTRYEYVVQEPSSFTRGEILNQFVDFVDAAANTDTLIFYFSGHGYTPRGKLLLLMNAETNTLKNAMPIQDVIEALEHCPAANKLIILDCCRAGAATRDWTFEQPSNYRLLTASERLEEGKEIDQLKASFLTYHLHQALTAKSAEIADEQGVIFLNRCYEWVKEQAKRSNAEAHAHQAPIPNLLGNQKADFAIGVVPEAQRRTSQSTGASPEGNDAQRQYLQQVKERYSMVALPIGPAGGLSLHTMFQPLALRSTPLAAEDVERRQRRRLLGELVEKEAVEAPSGAGRGEMSPDEKTSVLPVIAEHVEEALSKSPQQRIVVLGGPGTGKTTTLKHLVSHYARQALEAPSHITAFLPLFLSLADLARSKKQLQDYLVDLVGGLGIDRSYADSLWRAIERGTALIALDSLDEVAPTERSRMIELITTFAARPGNIWMVGSRFTDYKGGQLKHGQFAEWELLPMTRPMRQKLSAKLFPLLQQALLPSTDAVPSSTDFVQRIEAHPQAAAWGENPLLLSLAGAVFVKKKGLPSSRSALYGEVIDAVLTLREPDLATRELLFLALTSLALWLFEEKRGRTFTFSDVFTCLRHTLHCSWTEAETIAKNMVSSGILDIVAQKTYGFRHQTFQEYLAAAELSRRLADSDEQRLHARSLIWSKRTYSRWKEVLRLMVGILARSPERRARNELESWLQRLADQRTTEEGDPGDLGLLLALTSLPEIEDGVTGNQNTLKNSAQITQHMFFLWLEETLQAARRHRQTRLERLEALAQDLVHLHVTGQEDVIKRLIQALHDVDFNVRKVAANLLNILGLWAKMDVLLPLLVDPDAFVRRAVVEVLGSQGERVPVERLLPLLEDPDAFVWEAVVEVLGSQGEHVSVERLLPLLEDPDEDVREAVVRVLGSQGERVPVERLLPLLEHSAWTVREAVVRVLGSQGERVPVERLLPLLEDSDADVREAVVRVLGSQGERVPVERLLPLLEDPDAAVRGAVVQVLGSQGERVPVERLLPLLEDRNSAVRRGVVQVLGTQGERVPVERLLPLLEHRNPFVPRAVVQVLGSQGERVPVERLLPLLEDRNAYMRRAVVQALGSQGARVPVERLLPLLEDSHAYVRAAVVQVLGSQGERVPVERLLPLLEDPDADVRQATVVVLKGYSARLSIAMLTLFFSHRDGAVRQAATEILATLTEPIPLGLLTDLLCDEVASIRQIVLDLLALHAPAYVAALAAEALQVLDGVVTGNIFTTLSQMYVADTLGALQLATPSLLDRLTDLLDWPHWLVRLKAIEALGAISRNIPDRAIQRLLTLRRDHDPKMRFVREAADDALAEILSLETGMEDEAEQ